MCKAECDHVEFCDRDKINYCKLTGFECEESVSEDCETFREYTYPTPEEIRTGIRELEFSRLHDDGRL